MILKNRIIFIVFLLCFGLAMGQAQTRTLKGKVAAADSGDPLPGVTVVAVLGGQTAMSDEAGRFELAVPETETAIELSFLGYQRQRLSIAGRTEIDVRLVPDDELLDEVVVTGYQTERKKDLTGAVSVVKMEEISAPLTGNVMKSIQGRVPGTFITTNGSPDGAASVLIRGIGTLGNNNPLYVIDGMPSTSSMNEISGLDIASIQVLKDASSSSIYGSRAANGVIVITTKKGIAGRTKVDARASSAVKNYAKSLDWLDTEQRGRAQWRAARNDGTDPNFGVYSFQDHQDGNGNWMLDRVIVPEFIDAAQTMRAANTDWAKEIGRNAVVQNYNLTLTSGNESGKVLFSLDHFDNQGTVRGTYFERLSGRVNSDFDLVKGIVTVGENLSVTKTKRDALTTVTASRSNTNLLAMTRNIWPIVPVRTVDGIGWGGPVGGMSDRHNPVRLIADNAQNRNDMLRLFGDVHANVDILKGLRFRTMLGMDYSFSWERNMQKTYTSGYMSEDIASVNNYSNRWGNYVWNNTLNYTFDLADKHRFDLLAGQEMIDYYAENLHAGRQVYASETPSYMYLDAGQGTQTNSGFGTAYRLLSYFGKVNYNFGDKYLASATARYDGSSRFGANNRFGWFPAFSLGWRVSEEAFFRPITFISDLKVRYGWGKTGNQEIGDFASFGMYEAVYGTNPTWDLDHGTAYDIAGTGTGTLPSGYRRIQQANPNLRWEAAQQHNIGLDFALLGGKLSGSFDYFSKNTSDILILPPYIGTLGEGGNRWTNGAAMTNKGYEFLLSYASSAGDWRYNITGNLAGYRNKITELPEDVINSYPGNGNDQTILGRPLNSFFGYRADGLFTTAEQVAAHAAQTGKALGRIRYADISGNGSIGDEDRTWLGVMDPDFVYGLNISLSYKQFDFGMFWNGLYGGLVDNEAKRFTDFISFFSGENYGTRVLNAWSPDNPDSDIPALSFDDLNDEKRFSSYFIESGSYFKLRTVELGYTLPANLLQRFRCQGLRVYLLGENLLTLKKSSGRNKYTGVDPETPNSGYPIPFSVTAGISIAF